MSENPMYPSLTLTISSIYQLLLSSYLPLLLLESVAWGLDDAFTPLDAIGISSKLISTKSCMAKVCNSAKYHKFLWTYGSGYIMCR